MALFDISAQNVYTDYSAYQASDSNTQLPSVVLKGKTENAKTILQLTSYLGDTYSYINELV